MSTTARENILRKIKQALAQPVPVPFPASEGNQPIFATTTQENAILFAENFSKLQGRFSFCADEKELNEQLQALISTRGWTKLYCRDNDLRDDLSKAGFSTVYTEEINSCEAAITDCEALVARTGSIVLSSAQQSGRTVSVYAPVHICIARSRQLVYDIADGLQQMRDEYAQHFPSLVTLATGPSRTADIEKTLVVGVHGPKEVFCFLVDS